MPFNRNVVQFGASGRGHLVFREPSTNNPDQDRQFSFLVDSTEIMRVSAAGLAINGTIVANNDIATTGDLTTTKDVNVGGEIIFSGA